MIVEQLPVGFYTSNIYKISINNNVWFIDIGNAQPAINAVSNTEKVRGVFITHAHYDHIYGINHFKERFPECEVFASQYAKEGLYSDKINLSFYHENPVVYEYSDIVVINDGDCIPLSNNYFLKCIYTPGHNLGCICFFVENYFFTGDSFIPNIPVVTKLKSGNKVQNELSLKLIKSIINQKTVICPGHGPIVIGGDLFPD